MYQLPRPPTVPDVQCATAEVSLRYEDLSQDGRLKMDGMPHAIAEVFWRNMVERAGLGAALRAAGVVPILSRLCTKGGDGPLSVRQALTGHARYQLAHSRDEHGAVRRIFLNVWLRLEGVRGRTHGPPPEGAGEKLAVGEMFAEHIFTRPFAAAGERRVARLDVASLPEVPQAEHAWRPPQELLQWAAKAKQIDETLHVDAAPLQMGVDHTDPNQHVNALVYPRVFREAVLRRLAETGRGQPLLACYQETAFRKPSFAGERLRVAVQCFERDGQLGAVTALLDEQPLVSQPASVLATDSARCYGVVLFDR